MVLRGRLPDVTRHLRAGTRARLAVHAARVAGPRRTARTNRQAFAQTPDGYLWIGTTGGLVRFDGAHFTVFDRQNTPALHENSVFCLMVSRDGALWIGTEGGGLVRYASGEFRSWSTREGLSNEFVRTLAEDARRRHLGGHGQRPAAPGQGDHFVRVDGTAAIPALAVHPFTAIAPATCG